MAMPWFTILALGLLFILAIYQFILFPAFLSPLAKVPTAHWSTSISSLWIQYWRVKHVGTFKVHEAHQKYGPIIRLAPNELSINCIEGGLRTVYAGGYEKGSWYSNVFNNYNDVRPMFCMEDRNMHSKRKRMISNVYAKSTLQNSQALEAISKILLQGKLLSMLNTFAERDQIFDIFDIFTAVTMDMVTSYIVGLNNGSAFLDDIEWAGKFSRQVKARQWSTVWPQDLPIFTKVMTKLGLRSLLIPEDGDRNNRPDTDDWVLGMCDKAEIKMQSVDAGNADQEHPEHYPTVYAQLRSSMLKEAAKEKDGLSVEEAVQSFRYEVASEAVDHIIAGFDTSSITMTWLAWQMSRPKNIAWQKRLQSELRTIKGSTDPKTIDELPVLEAILIESLRLHAAIPGNQPRVTPENATLGPPGQVYSGLPANVRVQAQAWSLHRNPEVFPDPDSWQPARWLDASEPQHKEMMRWFWAFGSGGRMCVGSNFALYEMKAVIALIWSHFSTTVVFDDGMVPSGGYQAEPLGIDGRILEIRLEKL